MRQCEIFMEAVKRLCATLDLEAGLNSFFAFLCTHVPIRQMWLGWVDQTTHQSERLAIIRAAEANMAEPPERLTEEQFRQLQEGILAFDVTGNGVLVTDKNHPLARLRNNPEGVPFFYFRLGEATNILAGATFHIEPNAALTEGHLEILRGLHDPLLMALNNCLQYRTVKKLREQVTEENIGLKRELEELNSTKVIGARTGLAAIMRTVRQAAPVDAPVLLLGETGTGKEVIAKEIHSLSPRADKPFVAVNCGGIPPTLIDSELFGHVKGAFTGAISNHKGKFERAAGGTIFLDEISELPMEMQARLLRVLQEKNIERVGGSEPVPIDFRLIAASNRDLAQMVNEGTFRKDLYYRLRVVPIMLPPLRERRQDIPLLVAHFVNAIARHYKMKPPLIAPGEMEKLYAYNWPGNIRELQNLVAEAVVLNQQDKLHFRMPQEKKESRPPQVGNILTFGQMQQNYFQALLEASGGVIHGPHGAAAKAAMHPNTLRGRLEKLHIPYKKFDRA